MTNIPEHQVKFCYFDNQTCIGMHCNHNQTKRKSPKIVNDTNSICNRCWYNEKIMKCYIVVSKYKFLNFADDTTSSNLIVTSLKNKNHYAIITKLKVPDRELFGVCLKYCSDYTYYFTRKMFLEFFDEIESPYIYNKPVEQMPVQPQKPQLVLPPRTINPQDNNDNKSISSKNSGNSNCPSKKSIIKAYEDGFDDGKKKGYKTGYDEGFRLGEKEGFENGLNEGLKKSCEEAVKIAYENGSMISQQDDNENTPIVTDNDDNDTSDDENKTTFEKIIFNAYSKGHSDGINIEFDDGKNKGYENGLNQGYEYGLIQGMHKNHDKEMYNAFKKAILQQ